MGAEHIKQVKYVLYSGLSKQKKRTFKAEFEGKSYEDIDELADEIRDVVIDDFKCLIERMEGKNAN